jgi:hypothetical protein
MEIGDVIHLDGIKAEYSLFGKDRFSACTLPDGNYHILGFENDYVRLAWSDPDGRPSRKHRYRIKFGHVISTMPGTTPSPPPGMLAIGDRSLMA